MSDNNLPPLVQVVSEFRRTHVAHRTKLLQQYIGRPRPPQDD